MNKDIMSLHGYGGGLKLNLPEETRIVATGNTIKSGDLVESVISDKTVSLYKEGKFSVKNSYQQLVVDWSSNPISFSVTPLANGNILVLYGYNQSHYVIVIKINEDGTFTRGTSLSVFTNQITGTGQTFLHHIKDNKVALLYTVQNVGTFARLITVNGLVPALGNIVTIEANMGGYLDMKPLTNDRVLITYSNTYRQVAIIGLDESNQLVILKSVTSLATVTTNYFSVNLVALADDVFYYMHDLKIFKLVVNADNTFTSQGGTTTVSLNVVNAPYIAIIPLTATTIMIYYSAYSTSYLSRVIVTIDSNLNPVSYSTIEVVYAMSTVEPAIFSVKYKGNINFLKATINLYTYYIAYKVVDGNFIVLGKFECESGTVATALANCGDFIVQGNGNTSTDLFLNIIKEDKPIGIAKTSGSSGQQIKIFKL